MEDQQFLVMLVGHNASGKTTLAKLIEPELDINRVSADEMKDMLMSTIRFYAGIHYSYPNGRASSINKIVDLARNELIKELVYQHQNVLLDGAGITKMGRRTYREQARSVQPDIRTVIVEMSLDEKVLLERLKERDRLNRNFRWVDFYFSIRKGKYEPVEATEADHVLMYDQTNAKEVIRTLKDIVTG